MARELGGVRGEATLCARPRRPIIQAPTVVRDRRPPLRHKLPTSSQLLEVGFSRRVHGAPSICDLRLPRVRPSMGVSTRLPSSQVRRVRSVGWRKLRAVLECDQKAHRAIACLCRTSFVSFRRALILTSSTVLSTHNGTRRTSKVPRHAIANPSRRMACAEMGEPQNEASGSQQVACRVRSVGRGPPRAVGSPSRRADSAPSTYVRVPLQEHGY